MSSSFKILESNKSLLMSCNLLVKECKMATLPAETNNNHGAHGKSKRAKKEANVWAMG